MKKPNHVWVVELWDLNCGWHPCAACGVDKRQGMHFCREWRERCPNDKFRLKKYVQEEK